MKKKVWRIGLIALCAMVTLCACGPDGEDTSTTTTTTTVPTTTTTTGTPTTFEASADSGLQFSSPNGVRPSAETIERLAAICKAHRGSISVYYKDLTTGYTLTYDATKTYQAASVIKAPYVKYLLVSGVDGAEKLTLKSKMGGSSHIDDYPVGTQFTVSELMEYAIRYSDNSAYNLLNQRFGFDGFNEYEEAVGAQANKNNNLTLRLPKPRFGYLCAQDIGLYFEDIAAYIEQGSDEAKQLFSWLITTSEQRQLPDAYNGMTFTIEDLKDPAKLDNAWNSRNAGYIIGHKYGEQGSQAYHDGAIVWRDYPYVLAITSTLTPYEEDSIQVFHDIAGLVDQLQTELYTPAGSPMEEG